MTPLRLDLVFPRFKLLSGAERAILGLAGGLQAAGHRVRLLCHQFDRSCRPRLPDGVELVCTHTRLDWTRNRYLNAAADYGRCFGLRRRLDPAADLHLLFGPALPLVLSRPARRGVPAPVLYYCWEPPRALYQDRALVLERLGRARHLMAPLLRAYARVDRALVARADAVCTSSPFAAGRIETVYGRPASVITLGIDRARLDAVPPARDRAPLRVLSVNYLHPRKRVDLIIRAAAADRRLAAGDPRRVTWIIVGDGPERARLEALTRELGLTDVMRFTGFVADDELPKYYATASCYVHACLEESFGLSVIEAAYSGCPVVAVDEGGVRDTVVDGVTGHLVPADPAALAGAVRAVLSRDDTGRALGAAGRARVRERYRWERGASEIVELAREQRRE